MTPFSDAAFGVAPGDDDLEGPGFEEEELDPELDPHLGDPAIDLDDELDDEDDEDEEEDDEESSGGLRSDNSRCINSAVRWAT
ncbi:MAG: hypothetical protein AAGG01_24545 [Planctomycetota bacterium]